MYINIFRIILKGFIFIKGFILCFLKVIFIAMRSIYAESRLPTHWKRVQHWGGIGHPESSNFHPGSHSPLTRLLLDESYFTVKAPRNLSLPPPSSLIRHRDAELPLLTTQSPPSTFLKQLRGLLPGFLLFERDLLKNSEKAIPVSSFKISFNFLFYPPKQVFKNVTVLPGLLTK